MTKEIKRSLIYAGSVLLLVAINASFCLFVARKDTKGDISPIFHAYAVRTVSRYERLSIDAPETLQWPDPSDFVSYECFDRARQRFLNRGDWASDEGEGFETCGTSTTAGADI
jgi:hypothetical protein